MREILIQNLWESKWLIQKKLKTIDGSSIEIRQFGKFNTLQGPDFTECEIVINNISLSGAIEIHIKSSQWNLHKHQLDEKYNQVILHVVWEYDSEVMDSNQRILPTIELKQYLTESELSLWANSESVKKQFPCLFFHTSIPLEEKLDQLEQALFLRLSRKKQEFNVLLNENRGDWEQALFMFFARYWMNEQNRFSMEFMAQNTRINRLKKFSKIEQLAYWFGMSELELPKHQIEYSEIKILETFVFLKRKFGFEPVQLPWYYGKIRPAAYPDKRMMQWVQWLDYFGADMSRWLKLNSYNAMISNFTSEDISDIGINQARKLIANVIVPVWMLYGEQLGNPEYKKAAYSLMDHMPGEQNSLVDAMNWYGIKGDNLSLSQALVAQNEFFCNKKKCLECNLGKTYLQKTQSDAILL